MIILKKSLKFVTIFFLGALLGWFIKQYPLATINTGQLLSPLSEIPIIKLPLIKYRISELPNYSFSTSSIVIEKKIEDNSIYSSYLISYQTMGKKMTGVLNIPKSISPVSTNELKILIMIRGFVPPGVYTSGTGTKNAANFFASHGYITIAPDFFGYGESDLDFEDEWEARFAKPIQIVELINSIRKNGVPIDGSSYQQIPVSKLGIWAHSNGGQIALTVLETLREPIPTTLWAPVTAPFPYSILFYSDEEIDEGKQAREWVHLFEQKYDAKDFSLTQYINQLVGPIQLHHGSLDEAAPIAWSDEFAIKIQNENESRELVNKKLATASGLINDNSLPNVKLIYFRYPNADHNLQPDWNTVINRDLNFFQKEIK